VTPQRLKTIQENINQALQEGDLMEAQDRLMTSVPTTLKVDDEKRFKGVVTINDQLDNFKSKLDAYVAKGGDVGLIPGLYENFNQNIGTVKDPELRSLAAQMKTALIDYRQSVTGAAFTESEAKMYDDLFPGITKDPALNAALIEGLKQGFNVKRESILRQTIGNKPYEALFGEVTVRDRVSGQVGTMPKVEFDSNYYDIVK